MTRIPYSALLTLCYCLQILEPSQNSIRDGNKLENRFSRSTKRTSGTSETATRVASPLIHLMEGDDDKDESRKRSHGSGNSDRKRMDYSKLKAHGMVSRPLITDTETGTTKTTLSRGLSNVNDDEFFATPDYLDRVQYAFKLGFSEGQLKIALTELGTPNPKDDDLLRELIRLASIGKYTDEGSDFELEDDIYDSFLDDDELVFPQPAVIERKSPRNANSNLRAIVIDGSNVAMSHGKKEVFSCRGIKLAVDYFRHRGHTDITVFVPQWRKELSRPDAPIKHQDTLFELEKEKILVYTPSRRVGGKRVVCYDDRYVIKLAAETDGIVVSNDNYRDLVNEDPAFKKVIEERLLMYSFVNDRFMPPDDPLGRHGPTLDNFLLKEPMLPESLPPICPYLKKCTYGNKCKFYHPERGNKPQKSITERLAEEAQQKMQVVKERQSKELTDESEETNPVKTKSTENEDKERQRKHNENLDHYRKQVEESERNAARAKFQSKDISLETDSSSIHFPPPSSLSQTRKISDGTHPTVAKSLSDQSAQQHQSHSRISRRRLSVPECETEHLRRQFMRQASLQPRPLEEERNFSRLTYPFPEDSQPQPPTPPVSNFPTYPFSNPYHASYGPPIDGRDFGSHGYELLPDYPSMPGMVQPRLQQPTGVPTIGRSSSRSTRSYPPLMYETVYPRLQLPVSRSTIPPDPNRQWTWSRVPDAPMYPDIPDYNMLSTVSYATGPPVESEAEFNSLNSQEVNIGPSPGAMMVPSMLPSSPVVLPEGSQPSLGMPRQAPSQGLNTIDYHLSQIYGEENVRYVRSQYPNETRAHILATYLAQMPRS